MLICAVRWFLSLLPKRSAYVSFVLALLRACLGSVRRLSTQTSRTPYNSNVTMSPAAAELIQAQQTAIVDAEARLSATMDATSSLPGAIDTEAGADAGRPRVAAVSESGRVSCSHTSGRTRCSARGCRVCRACCRCCGDRGSGATTLRSQ
jgi:hypothetical protein